MMNQLVSIIVPTFNRPDKLRRCLYALLDQTGCSNYEILVIDDGSDVSLRPIIDELDSIRIKLFRQPNQGPASARNLGVTMAEGQLVAFVDDDCIADKFWLSKLVASHNSRHIVGGKTYNNLSSNRYSEASQILILFLYSFFSGTSHMFFTSNNFLLSRVKYLEIGGFDTGFSTSAGEDREFCVRWSLSGGKLKFVPEALMYHEHDLNLLGFLRLHFKYGIAAVLYRQKIRMAGMKEEFSKWKFFRELLKFLVRDNEIKKHRLAIAFLILSSQLAGFCGSAFQLVRILFNKAKMPKN